jgi:hypothetical protein
MVSYERSQPIDIFLEQSCKPSIASPIGTLDHRTFRSVAFGVAAWLFHGAFAETRLWGCTQSSAIATGSE